MGQRALTSGDTAHGRPKAGGSHTWKVGTQAPPRPPARPPRPPVTSLPTRGGRTHTQSRPHAGTTARPLLCLFPCWFGFSGAFCMVSVGSGGSPLPSESPWGPQGWGGAGCQARPQPGSVKESGLSAKRGHPTRRPKPAGAELRPGAFLTLVPDRGHVGYLPSPHRGLPGDPQALGNWTLARAQEVEASL